MAVIATSWRFTKALSDSGAEAWPWKVALRLTVPAIVSSSAPAASASGSMSSPLTTAVPRIVVGRRRGHTGVDQRAQLAARTSVPRCARRRTASGRSRRRPVRRCDRPPGRCGTVPWPPGASRVPAPSNCTSATTASTMSPTNGWPMRRPVPRSARAIGARVVVERTGSLQLARPLIDLQPRYLHLGAEQPPLGGQPCRWPAARG